MLIASVVLGVVVSGLAIPFAGLAGFGAREAAEGVDELPQDFEADGLPQTTRILDSEGLYCSAEIFKFSLLAASMVASKVSRMGRG